MKLRMYILSLLASGMALCLLLHFGCIWIFGEFFICEPNQMMLIIETVMMLAILGFSVGCIFDLLRSFNSRDNDSM